MSRTVLLLWAAVLLEMLSPIPAVLSIGTAYVLLTRPPWLPRLVGELYGAGSGPDAKPDP